MTSTILSKILSINYKREHKTSLGQSREPVQSIFRMTENLFRRNFGFFSQRSSTAFNPHPRTGKIVLRVVHVIKGIQP